MVFKWNGTWEDGEDHTGEVSNKQYWLRVCANCGHRRGIHTGKTNGANYVLERDSICPTPVKHNQIYHDRRMNE